MTADQFGASAAALLCLMLVGSALISRRLPWPQVARLALIWAAIIVGLVAVIRLLAL
jgi:hypothetical protein